jgi:hypothetical protein
LSKEGRSRRSAARVRLVDPWVPLSLHPRLRLFRAFAPENSGARIPLGLFGDRGRELFVDLVEADGENAGDDEAHGGADQSAHGEMVEGKTGEGGLSHATEGMLLDFVRYALDPGRMAIAGVGFGAIRRWCGGCFHLPELEFAQAFADDGRGVGGDIGDAILHGMKALTGAFRRGLKEVLHAVGGADKIFFPPRGFAMGQQPADDKTGGQRAENGANGIFADVVGAALAQLAKRGWC